VTRVEQRLARPDPPDPVDEVVAADLLQDVAGGPAMIESNSAWSSRTR
jgi:hypothetical protein